MSIEYVVNDLAGDGRQIDLVARSADDSPVAFGQAASRGRSRLLRGLKDELRYRGFGRPDLDVLTDTIQANRDYTQQRSIIQASSPVTAVDPTTDVLADSFEVVFEDQGFNGTNTVTTREVPDYETLHGALHGEGYSGQSVSVGIDDVPSSLRQRFEGFRRRMILDRGQSLLDAAGTGLDEPVTDATVHFPYTQFELNQADYSFPGIVDPNDEDAIVRQSHHFGVEMECAGTNNPDVSVGVRFLNSLDERGTLEGIRPVGAVYQDDPADPLVITSPETARSDDGYRVTPESLHDGVFETARNLDGLVQTARQTIRSDQPDDSRGVTP